VSLVRKKKSNANAADRSPAPSDLDAHSQFAQRLEELVAGAGSAAALAAQARVSEGAVRMWLSRVEPTREKLAAIAKETGVSLDWLISGRGPKFFSECPPGHIAIRFADLTKAEGVEIGAFLLTENYIFLPTLLLGIDESGFATHREPRVIDRRQIDPMALLLPPEIPDSAADFVVFNFSKEGASPPPEGSLCVTLDERRIKIRPARSSAGLTDMIGPILGPVIFRGAIVERKKTKRAEKSK
jgi:transcriptional regulator with XRE-family HTH domain